jgi:hypothetical protein
MMLENETISAAKETLDKRKEKDAAKKTLDKKKKKDDKKREEEELPRELGEEDEISFAKVKPLPEESCLSFYLFKVNFPLFLLFLTAFLLLLSSSLF